MRKVKIAGKVVTMSKRFDLVHMDKGALTTQGFLRVPAFLTRTGVFKYRKSDGTIIRELRHPDDVFEPLSMQSLSMAPLTNDHPKEFVTPDNVRELSVGWIGEVSKQENKIASAAIVADAKAIADTDKGKVELSCGYTADLVKEEGTYDGEPYDFRQKNIRYNHVALVERGRAGPQVRLRLDSEDAKGVEYNQIEETPKMKKIKIDGKEFEVSDEAAAAFELAQKAHSDALDAAKVAADKAKVDADAAEKAAKAETDKAKARADQAEEKLKEKKDGLSEEEIRSRVKERARIDKVAANVLGTEAKIEDKSDLEVMKEVISKASPKTELKDKSDVYVRARFDAIAEENEGREDRRFQLGSKTTKDSRKDEDFDADTARKKAHDSDRDLWKQPLAASKK